MFDNATMDDIGGEAENLETGEIYKIIAVYLPAQEWPSDGSIPTKDQIAASFAMEANDVLVDKPITEEDIKLLGGWARRWKYGTYRVLR